ncbi:MAG: T9SS type A sorting domain-containing protein, partial [Candidatus Hydrothermae bacterium]|nr:T9SS type A sorting domain-containing protein [Candidatus Hydrothermae bacterium]
DLMSRPYSVPSSPEIVFAYTSGDGVVYVRRTGEQEIQSGGPQGGEVGRVNGLKVEVAPNPAGDLITIRANLPFRIPLRFRLYDRAGRLVDERTFKELDTELKINIEKLPAGIYFYNLDAEGRHCHGKFVRLK